MQKIHILSPGFTNPNSCAFLFPLFIFRKELQEQGFNIRIFNNITNDIDQCDFLLIEHKFMSQNWHNEQSISLLQKWSTQTSIYWCDQSDSTGTFFGQVLPYVKKYLKAQILKDLKSYKKNYYADRIYTDFYHKRYNIIDNVSYDYSPAKTDEDLKKIHISWNSSMMNHGYYGPYIAKILKHIPSPYFMRFSRPFNTSKTQKSKDITCRMGIPYKRSTVRFQREQLQKILADFIATNKISRKQYFKELTQSKICISPFGYGEITLKDFESFLTGSALLKPDMTHLKTWPDLYQKDNTYIAHNWKLDDIIEVIEKHIENPELVEKIASNGQDTFAKHTVSQQAPERFTQHFKTLFT